MTNNGSPAVLSRSGGKDSALALWRLRRTREFELSAILTIFRRVTTGSTSMEVPASGTGSDVPLRDADTAVTTPLPAPRVT
jgi:hypothetical protein